MITRMFTSLKNKIKEETGSDVSRRFPVRPRSPRQGTNSTSSYTSTDSSDNKNFSTEYSQDDEQDKPKTVNHLNSFTNKEKELLTTIEALKKENLQAIDKIERQHKLHLDEKDREWKEKMTSLQNSMDAAQAVWSGEAAAARREAREESRKRSVLAEQLTRTTAVASRTQDRLDTLTEEIESERRDWALERIRLATTAEDALHRLSLAESPLFDESKSSDTNLTELALRRKLEEAQLHLHDIKTSWSGQIAALETQVGRLSRQAGEEGSERRQIEQERDDLLDKLREKEIQLEQAQATLEDKEAKMALLAAEVGDVARAGREAREEGIHLRDISANMENTIAQLEEKLVEMQNEITNLKNENASLKLTYSVEKNKCNELNKQIEFDKSNIEKLYNSEQEIKTQLINEKDLSKTHEEKCNDLTKQFNLIKDQNENLKKEVNEIHDRYDKERRDKDEALIRNAHMSQTLEIYRQEMRQQDVEVVEMKEKIIQLQKTVAQNLEDQNTLHGLKDQEQQSKNEIELLKVERDSAVSSEKQLQECIKDLNFQILEKSKNIRVLQNRLTDMKKTLQRELRSGQVDPLGSSVVEGTTEDPDVSKKYLKHVLIKFLTSREIEARQLTKAVGALLGLSEQEESLLRDTLSWRNGFAAWLTPSPSRYSQPHS